MTTPAPREWTMPDVIAIALFALPPSDQIALAGWGNAQARAIAQHAARQGLMAAARCSSCGAGITGNAHTRRLAEMAGDAPDPG